MPPVAAVVLVPMVRTPLAGMAEGPTASWLAVVLTTNSGVASAFWIWKAAAESAEFLKRAAPVLVKLATVVLLVSRFNPKLSLAPRVTAVPKELPPCKISPVPPTPAQLPEDRRCRYHQ